MKKFFFIKIFYLKEFIRVLRINNPTISRVFERVENDEILRYERINLVLKYLVFVDGQVVYN
jgi:hypothetical protein